MEDRESGRLWLSPPIRTFVGVNLDVIRGEKKLSEVEQPRVDVPAVDDNAKSNLQPARCPVSSLDYNKLIKNRRTS